MNLTRRSSRCLAAPLALCSLSYLLAPAAALAPSAHGTGTRAPGRSHGAAGFDVECPLDVIDQAWTATVVVERPNEAPLEVTVTLDDGQTEDAMAARVAFRINGAHGGPDDIASVEPVPDGPDLVVIEGGSISITELSPREGGGVGRIHQVYASLWKFDPVVAVPTEPHLIGIDVVLEPFQGADLLFAATGLLVDGQGIPSTRTKCILLEDGQSPAEAAQQLVTALRSAGFHATLRPPHGLRIEPRDGGPRILNYQFTLGPARPLAPGQRPSFGMRVGHGAAF